MGPLGYLEASTLRSWRLVHLEVSKVKEGEISGLDS